MTGTLALIDFPAIKAYVFGTDRAREIRGASALLDELNVKRVPEELRAAFGHGLDTICAGGGSGVFVVRNAGASDVQPVLARIAAGVEDASAGGLRLAWAAVPLADGEQAFSHAVRRAHLELAARRERVKPAPRLGHGLLRGCDSCSSPGVRTAWRDGDEPPEWLCAVCLEKRRHRRSGRSWQQLVQALGLAGEPERHRPDDFAVLAERCSREGYAAVIYLDGDSMGRVVKRIRSPEAYRAFSHAVGGSLRDAVFDAVDADWDRLGAVVPADILLLGGDDLIMVVPADRALGIATRVCRRFSELTQSRLSDDGDFAIDDVARRGLSVSAGIAIFKSRQPFRVVLEQAEALLSSAKRERLRQGDGASYIDLCDVSQSRFVTVEDTRRLTLGVGDGPGPCLTLWPMAVDRAERFHASVQALARARVARGRVMQLGEAVRGGRSAAPACKRILARTPEKAHRRALMDFLADNGMADDVPWVTRGGGRATGLLDLATIYPLYCEREAGV